jgi:tetratricopeptide (TPR) repeat protein
MAKGSEPGANQKAKPSLQGPSVSDSTQQTAEDKYNRGVYLFQVAQTQASKGNTQGQNDLLKQALNQFEDALELDDTMVEAQSNIGFAYLTLRKEKKAEKAFKKALEIDPNHLNTINGLATTQALRGRTEEALETFNELTLLDPGNAEYFFNKGSALQKANRFNEAEDAYKTAVALDPQHQQSWFNLATLYENNNQFNKAANAYEEVKHLDITTAIGLEATNRLQWLQQALTQSSTSVGPSHPGAQPAAKTAGN